MESVVNAKRVDVTDEILIVDDGNSDDSLIVRLTDQATGAGFEFVHHVKRDRDGLYGSRRLSAGLARGDVIIFLDDDVEIASDFLTSLSRHYDENSHVVGVGGIDRSVLPTLPVYLFGRVFLIASGQPGRLSLTGLTGSFYKWYTRDEPFETEYMSGYCMSFRRHSITELSPLPWLNDYSIGEDLIVSHEAAKHGRLLLDPALSFTHHRSPTNRWSEQKHIAEWMLGAIPRAAILRPNMFARTMIYWSLLGIVLTTVLRLRPDKFVVAARALALSLRPYHGMSCRDSR